jgi:amino acid adenylation domain-containing protein
MTMNAVEDIYPLSPTQQGMLFHTLYAPLSGVYIEQFQCTLQGELQSTLLQRAWQQIIDRHAILRTAFLWEGLDEPLQIVYRQVNVPWTDHDWRTVAPAEQQLRLESFLQSDRTLGFPLSAAPLMRLNLIRVAEHDYQLIWSFHHIVLDGWCLPLIMKEVFVFYEALRHRRAPQLAPSRPYRDYIAWLQQQDMGRAEVFWRQALHGFQAPTRLEVDHMPGKAPEQDDDYEDQEIQIPAMTTTALETFARKRQLTLNTLVQGAWALLLSRYSAERDVVFGTVVSGRSPTLPGVESMVGIFINTLPMRVHVAREMILLSWLKQIRHQQSEMGQYEYSPLVDIQRWSDLASGQPLFESIVAFENYPMDLSTWAGSGSLRICGVRFREKTNYPLSVIVSPGAMLAIRIAYNARRFDHAVIARLLDQFQTVLAGMIAYPQQRLMDVPYLTAAEHRQIVSLWNATELAYPRDACLHHLFEAQVMRTPDAVAVVFERPPTSDQRPPTSEDGRSIIHDDAAFSVQRSAFVTHLTYHELDARANRLAWHLRTLGAGPEARVGICTDRSPDMVIGLLGILKAGAAYVPLDPAYPAERLAFMIEDAQVAVLITSKSEETRPESLPDLGLAINTLRASPAAIVHRTSEIVHPDNLAYVIYTSGSTGHPKGVAIAHRSATAMVSWARTVFTPGDLAGVLAATSICFDLSIFELFVPLCSGGAVILAENALELPDLSAAGSVTLVNTVPSAIAELVRIGGVPRSVRTVNLAGEPLHKSLAQRLYEQPTITRVFNLYGPTEDTTYSTVALIPREGDEPPSIGRPLGNTQVYLLDADLQPVPPGIAGELYLGGAGLARCYLNRPDLTAERFVPNPFATTNDERRTTNDERDSAPFVLRPASSIRLYATGDLARYRRDGAIEFLGRRDQQVKLRGYRIELGEIEAALDRHPAVQESVVVVQESTGGDRFLAAYVVPAETQSAERRAMNAPEWSSSAFRLPPSALAGELRDFLRACLPEYMLPATFALLGALPRTPNGKVDRQALPTLDRYPAVSEHSPLAPRTFYEAMVADIWADVLQLEQVGIHDNFFELGGHSLLATRVMSRVRDTFQVELSLHSLFESPTVVALVARIEMERRAMLNLQAPPILPAIRDKDLPLSFAQQRLWFLDQLAPGMVMYNIATPLRLTGTLNLAALYRSLCAIIQRHEALRTTFALMGSRPIQIIVPTLALRLPVVDLSGLPEAEREAEAMQRATAESQQPFDLARGPLLRITLLRLGELEHLMLLTMHHIISDGWSIGVFVRELAALYNACCAGSPASLPELPIQYADFALWQRQWLQGEVLETQLTYWRRSLADLPALELPIDQPRPPLQTFQGACQSFEIPKSLAEALTALSRQEGATLFMSLLAAFQIVLCHATGGSDIVVGTDIANRTRSETEGLIGFFVNQLVLRTNLAGNPGFREVLQRVRDIALSAYAHQDLPFEYLVKELQPERDLGRMPLFQVKIVLQNVAIPDLQLSGLAVSPVNIDTGTAKIDLLLNIVYMPHGLAGSLEYSTDLFKASTVARIIAHFTTILHTVVPEPDITLSRLVEILQEQDKQQQIVTTKELSATSLQRLHTIKQKALRRSLSRGDGAL